MGGREKTCTSSSSGRLFSNLSFAWSRLQGSAPGLTSSAVVCISHHPLSLSHINLTSTSHEPLHVARAWRSPHGWLGEVTSLGVLPLLRVQPGRCRANLAHVRQSRPDYGLNCHEKVLQTIEQVLSSIGRSFASVITPATHGHVPPFLPLTSKALGTDLL